MLLVIAGLAVSLMAPGPSRAAASQDPSKGKKPTTISAVLTPARVTVNQNGAVEPTGVLAVVEPAAAGREISFYRDGSSTPIGTATTDQAGRAFWPVTLTTADLATDQHQVTYGYHASVASTQRFGAATSASRTLIGYDNTQCGSRKDPVTRGATGPTYCLAARLDAWGDAHVMGIGQQLNVSSKPWTGPLDRLPHQPAVLGFDLEELDKSAHYEYPFADEVVADLIRRAHDGAVLVASWHATNPWTQGPFTDRRHGADLARLLSRGGSDLDKAAYDRFWADWDAKLDLLARFQNDDSDGDGVGDAHPACWCTSVVVRPLHEANGDFFWWGKRDPKTFRLLFAALQERAADRGVRNLLWAFSANRHTKGNTAAPKAYQPAAVDVGGLDTYDPDYTKADAKDAVGLEGYRDLRPSSRVALTEVGPHGSRTGDWNPAVITRTARKADIAPLWAMLWFDDGRPTRSNPVPGKKQLTSLTGGGAFVRSCFDPALCYLGG